MPPFLYSPATIFGGVIALITATFFLVLGRDDLSDGNIDNVVMLCMIFFLVAVVMSMTQGALITLILSLIEPPLIYSICRWIYGPQKNDS